jgi:hypothetical protein
MRIQRQKCIGAYMQVKPQCVGLNYDELIKVQPHAECFT